MKVLICIAVLATAAVGLCQLYPTPLGITGAAAFRLTEIRVQQEFRISASQAQAIQEIIEQHGALQTALSKRLETAKSNDFESIQKQIENAEVGTSRKIVDVLNPDQRKRLREVSLQEIGPFAMRNAEIAKELGLTPAQRNQVEALAKKTVLELDEINAKMASELEAIPDGKAGDAKRTKVVMSYDAKLKTAETQKEKALLALLSKPQQATWQKLLGRPFKL